MVVDFLAQAWAEKGKRQLYNLQAFYLSRAGFFSEAAKYSEKAGSKRLTRQRNPLVTKLEWYLLAGNYGKARHYANTLANESAFAPAYKNNKNYLKKAGFLQDVFIRFPSLQQASEKTRYNLLKALCIICLATLKKQQKLSRGCLQS